MGLLYINEGSLCINLGSFYINVGSLYINGGGLGGTLMFDKGTSRAFPVTKGKILGKSGQKSNT